MCLGIGLEPPVEELEPLRFVLHRLTAALADQLVARGAATGRVSLRLSLDPAFARSGSPTEMSVEQRLLRNRLRSRGRALGDQRDPRTGTPNLR